MLLFPKQSNWHWFHRVAFSTLSTHNRRWIHWVKLEQWALEIKGNDEIEAVCLWLRVPPALLKRQVVEFDLTLPPSSDFHSPCLDMFAENYCLAGHHAETSVVPDFVVAIIWCLLLSTVAPAAKGRYAENGENKLIRPERATWNLCKKIQRNDEECRLLLDFTACK
jgi:hypothetical protein